VSTRALLATRSGIRARSAAAGKALLYLVLAFVGALLATFVAKTMIGASLLDLAKGGLAPGIVRALLLFTGTVVLPSMIALRLFRDGFATTGWALPNALKLVGVGVASGFGLLVGIAAILWAIGAITFHYVAPSVSAAMVSFAMSAVLWVAQSAGEEGLNRGYAFLQACRAIAIWPAAILSSVLFMYGHLGNEGETMLGIFATGLLGLTLSYSVIKTGSLWFALGFHASWNFTQSFLLGFHNSGVQSPASWFSTDITGPTLLTGGTVGPEGSILLFPTVLCLLLIIRRIVNEAQPVIRSPGNDNDRSTNSLRKQS